MKSLILIIFISLLTACNFEANQRPSVLLIAVEGLGYTSQICGEKDSEFSEGIGALCEDGVRFSHAFTPSLMSQSAMSSMLTGLYPIEHRVWHNGSQFVSEQIVTVAEKAIQNGYRTAFISGGAPVFRKSGLGQGFELFDDHISVSAGKIFRPVNDNFLILKKWLEESDKEKPFFSVIYLADLQFPQATTMNELGQERARVRESQLAEINESFAQLKTYLSKSKRWQNTYIIFAGVNGQGTPSVEREYPTLSLNSDTTQVFLVIKPASKNRESNMNWSIDVNVNLVDVGATIAEIVDVEVSHEKSILPVYSLLSTIEKPKVSWDRDRMIMSATAWADWRGVGETRFALRKKHFLYIDAPQPLIFNTLVDRFEGQPLNLRDQVTIQLNHEFQDTAQRLGLPRWQNITENLIEKLKLAQDLDFNRDSTEEFKIRLTHLIQQRIWDKQLVGWLGRIAIAEQNWALLKQIGKEHIYPVWEYVASNNLNQPTLNVLDVCWQLLVENGKKHVEEKSLCTDEEFIALTNWIKEKDRNKKNILEERFFKIYNRREIDEAIALHNFRNGLIWDTVLDMPAEPRLAQLALSLGDFKSYKNTIERKIKR